MDTISGKANALAHKHYTWLAALLLLLTAVLALIWSHHKLLWVDELLVLETDSVPTLLDVLRIQRLYPISLDPMAYHALSHGMIRVMGPTVLAIRLPSLLGYLLMQAMLFVFVRRIAGERAGLIALLLPALTGTLYYAVEARPYGMLLGIFGVTIASYQAATRDSDRGRSLCILAISLALAPNTHYFGVLLFVPVWLAEAVRTLERKRLDWPVIAALCFGVLGIVGTLPFQKGLNRFRLHYYNNNIVTPHAIAEAYRLLLINYGLSPHMQRNIFVLFVLVLVLSLFVCAVLRARLAIHFPVGEFALVLLLALYPVFGYLLARYVTHSMEVRYVLGGVLGISVLLSVAMGALLKRNETFVVVLGVLTVAVLFVVQARIRAEQQKSAAILASLLVPYEIKAKLLSGPDTHIYFQEGGYWQVARYYEPDKTLSQHFTLLTSFREEMQARHRETESLTADHLPHFTALPVVDWDAMKQMPGPHHLIQYHSQWDWSPEALSKEQVNEKVLGSVFDGEALDLEFPAQRK
ncbi:MAG: glycosyltransferase family 39 protein [Acidobacteriaceae bacterium]|nr:glycosyltransferase family 39 protein [Acidobacteriaceae bacterium]